MPSPRPPSLIVAIKYSTSSDQDVFLALADSNQALVANVTLTSSTGKASIALSPELNALFSLTVTPSAAVYLVSQILSLGTRGEL